jgi:hypothetical protein
MGIVMNLNQLIGIASWCKAYEYGDEKWRRKIKNKKNNPINRKIAKIKTCILSQIEMQ